MESNEEKKILAEMSGPEFEQFKEAVIRKFETSRQSRIELVKQHTTTAFPDYGGGHSYTNATMIFAPNQMLYAVRPLKQQGELIAYNFIKGTTRRVVIPQPKGFKAKYDFSNYFDSAVLSVNSSGDLLCRWQIEGNGDHGFALLKKGSDSFVVKRVNKYLADSYVIADAVENWHLVEGGHTKITVYRADKDLNLTRLGDFAGKGYRARFISNDMLHFFWAGSPYRKTGLSLRCVDFDVKHQKWLHKREILQLDKFVYANNPTVIQLKDESLHYFWGISEGAKPTEATGLYYQSEVDGKTVKIAQGYDFQAIAVGNRIIVCYVHRDVPEKVFFRVINHGAVGSVSEVTVNKGRDYSMWSENMLIHAESDRIWFVNTMTENTLYELKMVDAKMP